MSISVYQSTRRIFLDELVFKSHCCEELKSGFLSTNVEELRLYSVKEEDFKIYCVTEAGCNLSHKGREKKNSVS